jgi:hypothetical protein
MTTIALLTRILAIKLIAPASLAAQDLEQRQPPPPYQELQKAQAMIPDPNPLCHVKTSMMLDSRFNLSIDNIEGTQSLYEPSTFKHLTSSVSHKTEELLATSLALFSAVYQNSSNSSETCASPRQQILSDPATVLDVVRNEIAANPSSACEIVKAAIEETLAENDLVARIVETAILASPESMRMICQCAIASAPDSLATVQAILAKLDANAGDGARSAKSAKVYVSAIGSAGGLDFLNPDLPNPLDRPLLLSLPPGPIMPPLVTRVDP